MQNPLTHNRLRQLLRYDPDTGGFTWLAKPSVKASAVKIGAAAGTLDSKGYPIIKIGQKVYKAHRLAWFYVFGKWPLQQIDHKDGDPSNCRWNNLREATSSQNNINSKKALGRSGLRGAAWVEHQGRWKACIRANGRRLFLGYFDDPEAAHAAYVAAARRLHGDFARVK